MKDWGASPNLRHSILIVTDEHHVLDMAVKMSDNGFKKKNREKRIIFVEYGVAKHRLVALMSKTVPKTTG